MRGAGRFFMRRRENMDRPINVDVAGGPDGDAVSDARSLMCGMVLSPSRVPEPITPCGDLIAFADGELDSERAAAFRIHLRTCEACQSALIEAVKLSARLSELTPRSKM
jgi:hypothetical protein